MSLVEYSSSSRHDQISQRLSSPSLNASDNDVIVINDTNIESILKSDPSTLIIYDIKAKKTTSIPSQSQSTKVRTNIAIDGPVYSVSMYVKRHIDLPIAGKLLTNGFIWPWAWKCATGTTKAKGKTLKVFMGNPKNYEIK